MPRRRITSHTGVSEPRSIRILIIDDHSLVRAGLRVLIESQSSIRVIGDAGRGADAVRMASQARPDVILLDLELESESAVSLVPDLLKSAPSAKIIGLTGGRDSDILHKAVRAGARGIVLKDQTVDVLVKAIEKVDSGELWLDRKMTARIVEQLSRPPRIDPNPEAAKIATLTSREREVVTVVCEGLPNREVGRRLFVSEVTVRHHLTSIYSKLGVNDRFGLALYAFRQGLAEPPS